VRAVSRALMPLLGAAAVDDVAGGQVRCRRPCPRYDSAPTGRRESVTSLPAGWAATAAWPGDARRACRPHVRRIFAMCGRRPGAPAGGWASARLRYVRPRANRALVPLHGVLVEVDLVGVRCPGKGSAPLTLTSSLVIVIAVA
jgi:hypothetical protein